MPRMSNEEAAMRERPEVVEIKNGWHAGSRDLNITVRGDTPEDAERRFAEAVKKAAELRSRPDDFANPS